MVKKHNFFKKGMMFILLLGICTTSFKAINPQASEQDITIENDEIEQLIMEKNDLKFTLRRMEDSPEKEQLQKEYEVLCTQLKERGVSDHITEDISNSDIDSTTYQASVPDLHSWLDDRYDVDSYYQYGTIDGGQTYQTLYKVVVTDKADFGYLSYVFGEQVLLKGQLINEAEVLQFINSSVKFVAGVASGAITNTILSTAVSIVIDALPDENDYNIIHGENVLSASGIGVDETVMYIYGYSEKNDRWIHLCTRNCVDVNYNLVLTYKDKRNKIQNKTLENCKQRILPDKGGKTQSELIQLIFENEDKHKMPVIDYVSTEFTISLSQSSSVETTLKLNGQANPYYLP